MRSSERDSRQDLRQPLGKAQADGVELHARDGPLSQETKAALGRVGVTSG